MTMVMMRWVQSNDKIHTIPDSAATCGQGGPIRAGRSYSGRAVLFGQGGPIRAGRSYSGRAVLFGQGGPIRAGRSYSGLLQNSRDNRLSGGRKREGEGERRQRA